MAVKFPLPDDPNLTPAGSCLRLVGVVALLLLVGALAAYFSKGCFAPPIDPIPAPAPPVDVIPTHGAILPP